MTSARVPIKSSLTTNRSANGTDAPTDGRTRLVKIFAFFLRDQIGIFRTTKTEGTRPTGDPGLPAPGWSPVGHLRR